MMIYWPMHLRCSINRVMIVMLFAIALGNVGVAIYVYIKAENGSNLINSTGKLRALTRHAQHHMTIYGVGSETNDKLLPHILAKLCNLALYTDGIFGGDTAARASEGLVNYVTNYITGVNSFYAFHNITLYTSPVFDTLDVDSRYKYLLQMRYKDPSNWSPVIGKIYDEFTVFKVHYSIFDSMVEDTVGYVNMQQKVLVGLTVTSTLLLMFLGLWYVYLVRSNAKREAFAQITQAKAETYQSVLNNLNHELKGFSMRLRHVAEEALKDTDYVMLDRMLDHLNFSLRTIDQRCNSSLSTSNVLIDLTNLADVVQTMLPDITIETSGKNEVIGDPGYYYAAMYQIARNACIHGMPPFVMKIDECGIVMTNSPGKHHTKLLALSTSDALLLCKSGNVGTVTSSGQGLRDVQQVSQIICADFSIQFVPGMVIASLLFREPVLESTMITKSVTLANKRPKAILIVDDDKIPRLQGKGIAKKLLPDVALDEWDPVLQECTGNPRVCILGHNEPNIDQIIKWVRNTIAAGNMVVALIDYFLEYGGGIVLLGTTLMEAVTLACKDLPEGSVILYIRSGNDSVDNEKEYIHAGAHGMISKALKPCAVVDIIATL